MSENTAIAKHEQPNEALTIGHVLQVIMDRPDLPIANMQALLAMHERMETTRKNDLWKAAMKACQSEIKPIVKDAKGENNSMYAKLETIDRIIKPIYAKHGFVLSFNSVKPDTAGNVRLECLVSHEGGGERPYYLEAPPDTTGPKGGGVKTGIQGVGSTDSYLRRYLKTMIFDLTLVGLDNDGYVVKYITQAQQDTLHTMLVDAGRLPDLDRFLAIYNAGSLGEINSLFFADAVQKLKAAAQK